MPRRDEARCTHFYPRPPRGGRPQTISNAFIIPSFLSTPSARRATKEKVWEGKPNEYFYPRPPRGGRQKSTHRAQKRTTFLSTPSARRATRLCVKLAQLYEYFYPRPPRGGRRSVSAGDDDRIVISIHALREEGDGSAFSGDGKQLVFLSTPSARRATLRGRSILGTCAFLSTPSARRATHRLLLFLLPEQFLSTPSARRATVHSKAADNQQAISIHALREEGDADSRPTTTHRLAFLSTPSARRATQEHGIHRGDRTHFYPRPPRGGRQQKQRENTLLLSHYTPLCTNCKEMLAKQTAKSHRYLRKRLVFRCEASRKTMCAAGSHWPDIKRSARCLGQILGAVQRARPSSGSCCPAGRTADCPRRGRSGRSALL